MMTTLKFVFCTVVLFIVLSACTIQKRVHQKGYYISSRSIVQPSKKDEKSILFSENELSTLKQESVETDLYSFYTVEKQSIENTDTNSLHSPINSSMDEQIIRKKSFQKEGIVILEQEKVNTIDSQKEHAQPFFFYHNTALFYAFLAHFGALLMLVGFILYFMTIIDLGLIIFLIFGITFNLLGTLGGAIDLFFGRAEPDILPLFTKVSIIGYGLLWLVGILGVGVLAAL